MEPLPIMPSFSESETSSDEMPLPSPSTVSPTRRRVQAIHGDRRQPRPKKRPHHDVIEDSQILSSTQIDVSWPGALNTADLNTIAELEDSQRVLQDDYAGQIDPALLNLSAVTPTVPAAPSVVSPSPNHTTVESTAQALARIQNEAHLNRLRLQQQLDNGKGTNEAYPRHVKNYEKFWEADQNRRAKLDPNHIRTPAHPIIGEKVSIFLFHEMNRNKVRFLCHLDLLKFLKNPVA